MTPKGTKTGKGRRNVAAQRVDQLFAEVRELRAQIIVLRNAMNALESRASMSQPIGRNLVFPGSTDTGTPLPPPPPIVTC